MHLFHDSTLNTWRLITDKLPEKPVEQHNLHLPVEIAKWERAIAAIKQNALTVGNPEVLKGVGILELPFVDGGVFKWHGTFEEGFWEGKVVIILIPPYRKKLNTEEKLEREGYPLTMTISRSSLADIIDRYTLT